MNAGILNGSGSARVCARQNIMAFQRLRGSQLWIKGGIVGDAVELLAAKLRTSLQIERYWPWLAYGVRHCTLVALESNTSMLLHSYYYHLDQNIKNTARIRNYNSITP